MIYIIKTQKNRTVEEITYDTNHEVSSGSFHYLRNEQMLLYSMLFYLYIAALPLGVWATFINSEVRKVIEITLITSFVIAFIWIFTLMRKNHFFEFQTTYKSMLGLFILLVLSLFANLWLNFNYEQPPFFLFPDLCPSSSQS